MLIRFFIISFFSIFLLSGCGDENAKSTSDTKIKTDNSEKVIKKPEKEKGLSLKTLDGDTLNVSKTKTGLKIFEHSGKVVLVNFFATWCPPCKAEIPHLNSLQDRYKETLSVVGIALEDRDLEYLNRFRDRFDIQYTVTYGEDNFALSDLLGGVQTIPYMILYDKNGNYVTHYDGAVPEEMIEADIKKSLKI